MNKSDLLQKLLVKFSNLQPTELERMIDVVLASIKDAVTSGKRAEFRGFGSFSSRIHSHKNSRNPKTGEKLEVAARNRVYFRMSRTLADNINR